MDLEDSLTEVYRQYVDEKVEEEADDADLPDHAAERLKEEKLDQLAPVLEEMVDPLQERTDSEIGRGADMIKDILENGPEENSVQQDTQETVETESEPELDGFEVYEKMNVWRTGNGELEIKLENRDDELHKEASYVAEQLGLIENHGLEGNDLNAARQGVRENGFETDYGDLDTDVPEEMREHLKQYLRKHGYLSEDHNGEGYVIDSGVVTLEDKEFSFPVWDSEGLSDEASVLGYILAGDEKLVEFDGDHFQESYLEAYRELEEAGLVESGDRAERKNRYRVNGEAPEGLLEDIQELVVKTLEGDIQIGNVDSVRNGEVTIRYNGNIETVEEYNVGLGQKVAYDTEENVLYPLEV